MGLSEEERHLHVDSMITGAGAGALSPSQSSLLSSFFKMFKALDLMLVLVNTWFQHSFFVTRLTSQLPLSPTPRAHLGFLFLELLL